MRCVLQWACCAYCVLSKRNTLRKSDYLGGGGDILSHMLSWRKISPLNFYSSLVTKKSRDSSVGIALGYGLDDRGSGVRFPAGAGNFSLHHRVKNGSGAYPASYPMGTRGFFPGGKAAGA
jgi:hypothetical protein